MAYLGNQPVIGDSTNTFKLLDDISTFTLTFDGSSASVVSVANDTLTFRNHRFVTGQRVVYSAGGGTKIAGLPNDNTFFIIKVDQNTIKLATNASNAASSTAIDLTGLGAGTSHTLNVAFDGVNTKFKATHTNGKKAGVSRAAQLSLSINGVIQQPTEAKPPTVGYGIEADSTIVFSTAPVNTDKIFASFIGEVAASFDITDNTINNFTGDGSTASFNLSKEIPSNNDVLVTLDGVTQHPSDTSTTRAYSVIGSTLTFTTAPADGVAIQARLIGFAGATTSAVTGFYGRTGNVALKNTDDITFQNANVGVITASKFVGELVGVVTATDFFVSGIATFASDVGIAGTLTYEDVTNIDSVGLITARSGIQLDDSITHIGDTNTKIRFPGDDQISFETAGVERMIIGTGGNIGIEDVIQHKGDTNTKIRFPSNDTISFETGGSERVRVTSGGKLLVGTDSSRSTRAGNAGFNPDIQLESSVSALSLSKFNDSDGPSRLVLQKARGSQSSPTIVQDNDEVGSLTFSGWDGDTFTNTAQIRSEVEGTPGDDDMPGNLVFYTNADGSSTTTERLRITSTGEIGINNDSPSNGQMLSVVGRSGYDDIVQITAVGTNMGARINLTNTGSGVSRLNATNNSLDLQTSGTTRLAITDSDIDVKQGSLKLTKQGGTNSIEVGSGQNANNYAFVDFIGDTTYTDYGLRILRGNTGANADSDIFHRGTGTLDIRTQEAGDIKFSSDDTERLRIRSDGLIQFFGTNEQDIIHVTTGNAAGNTFGNIRGDNEAGIRIRGGGSSQGGTIELAGGQRDTDPGLIKFSTGTTGSPTERMRISAAGFVSGNINVPAWFGHQDTQHSVDTAAWTTIINLGNAVVNPSMNNSGWNESTGIFTVQSGQAGYYYCFGSAGIDDVQDSDIVRVALSKNDAAPAFFVEQRCIDQGSNVVVGGMVFAQVIQLAVGDTVKLQVYHNEGTTETTEANRCWFGGYRLGI